MNQRSTCPLGTGCRERSRRDVLRVLGRGAGLAGIGALVAVLARRWLHRRPECRTVPRQAVCQQCSYQTRCPLLDETLRSSQE